jgi:hypothetical protein
MLKTFNCTRYVSQCSATFGYEAYKNCAATVAVNDANDMACRVQHLAAAAKDAATHCPHAAPNAAAPCNTEMLKTFDCAAYASRCSGTSGYEAYKDCAATVAVNDANDMACRVQHLAAAASDAATHCPHAAPNAAAPCNTEVLKTFDCAAYVSRCNGTSGYEAYSYCAGTVKLNGANGMACRIQHLAAAASDAATHCPHAAPNAAAPCNTEVLLVATTTTTAKVAPVDTSKLEGVASFHVPPVDIDVFVSNQTRKNAMKEGFAVAIKVPVNKFTKFHVTKTSNRRLGVDKEASARQLATANINVAYAVDLGGVANAIKIAADAKALKTAILQQKVQES